MNARSFASVSRLATSVARPFLLASTAALGLVLAGCTSPVAVSLDEEDANRIVVALERASIEATKEADPGAEGKYRVLVAREESGRALSTLRDEELPRPRHPGVLDAMDKNALVPSQAAEHAQLVAGLSGDLQRTLEGVEGVLSARVHLNLPSLAASEGLPSYRDTSPPFPRASASVLLSYRGPTAPISDIAVQRLVAGGAPGLAPGDVAVVMIARPAPASPAGSMLTHVGPFVLSRGSVRLLEVAIPMVLALAFAFSWFVYFTRFTRLRAELDSAVTKPGKDRR
ncbi:hypothetical protein [Pendulispora albinea]|uniref:Flagellar M-ring N-terminal domain-containing protein n=1 Tax=Pendulispora albinea TaxID=2741071 RepID=A0ABZ2M9R5_9BACT